MTKSQTLAQLTGLTSRQAITTRARVTDDAGSQSVIATCVAMTVTVDWDDALDIRENHAAAALALMAKLGWDERNHLVCGSLPDELGFAFVQVEPPTSYPVPNLEYAVDDCSGRERIFKTPDAAAGFAVAIAMSGRANVSIDVLTWDRDAAVAYGGDDAGEVYDEDPEASVHDRIVIKAESMGRVA